MKVSSSISCPAGLGLRGTWRKSRRSRRPNSKDDLECCGSLFNKENLKLCSAHSAILLFLYFRKKRTTCGNIYGSCEFYKFSVPVALAAHLPK
uniref:Uncharacterized protein n=1 Tax=Arundo donax TaxID=35708 RepID=A0A0A9FIP9_ARUDO